jgi:hypothetical protein
MKIFDAMLDLISAAFVIGLTIFCTNLIVKYEYLWAGIIFALAVLNLFMITAKGRR